LVRILVLGVAGALPAAALAAGKATTGASLGDEWVWPRVSTTPPEPRTLTLLDHYDYREMRYDPPYLIDAGVPKAEARYDRPEYVVLARISAMLAGDYDWWLQNWDPESREFIARKNAENGDTPESWVTLWKDRLRFMRFKLVRRIESGPYVIVTYHLVTPKGADAGNGLEMPIVLHRVGERWYATQALHKDPFLPASPWVTGQKVMEVDVR